MAVVGNLVVLPWTILDNTPSSNPLSGVTTPAGITFTLHRTTPTGIALATEGIGFLELASSGTYQITFTPTLTGLYLLQLKELHASSLKRQWPFYVEVLTAGAVFAPSYANAFCAETDIERWSQLAIDGSSKPDSNQAAGFAQSRASEIRAILAGEGWVVSPASLSAGIEQDILREANAIGAAADCIMAKFLDTEPARTEKATLFQEEYARRLERLVEYANDVSGRPGIGSPMTQGEVTLRDETQIEDDGLRRAIRWDQEF